MVTNEAMNDLWSRAVEIADLAKLLERSFDASEVPAGAE